MDELPRNFASLETRRMTSFRCRWTIWQREPSQQQLMLLSDSPSTSRPAPRIRAQGPP